MIKSGTAVAQAGIRQRSLRKHCRLGRATELVFVLASGVMLTIGGTAQAQQWDGSDSDAWETGTNWVGDAAPGAGDNVVINDGAAGGLPNDTVLSTTTTVTTTTLSGNGNLVIGDNGSLENTGGMTMLGV
ncbi:MAG: hypothetical protein WAO69_13610 [Aestuariivita sp.]|uniref:hypothetical protein n=1 Tax=Aestuariivita sp. TaxID=1872407 RepID=UPI003BB0CE46